MKTLLLFLLFSFPALAQWNPDSLMVARQRLDDSLLEDIQELEKDSSDFVLIRVNDSLAESYDSYTVIRNDSTNQCTSGGTTFIEPDHASFSGSPYVLLYGSISFRSANLSVHCVNRFTDLEYAALQPTEQATAFPISTTELRADDYVIYGRAGNVYFYKQMSREVMLKLDPEVLSGFLSTYIYGW